MKTAILNPPGAVYGQSSVCISSMRLNEEKVEAVGSSVLFAHHY